MFLPILHIFHIIILLSLTIGMVGNETGHLLKLNV